MAPATNSSGLFRLFDRITELSVADRCLFLTGATLVPLAAFWLLWWVALREPGFAPYIDTAFLPKMLRIQTGYAVAWIAMLGLGIWARRNAPESKALAHVICQLAALWGFASYFLGHFTFLYLGMVMGYMVLLAAFFEARAVVLANVTFYVIVLATTVLEQAGVIPYGPVVGEWPVSEGHLASSWIFGIGGLTVLNWFCFLPLLFYASSRAREREAALRRASNVMRRYVPGPLVPRMLAGETEGVGRHERRKLTLFFSDVAGFTALADELDPEETSRLLNEYVAEMAESADRHGATLNQIVGDGLMVIFGAPEATDDRDHALRAVRMALDMQERVVRLRERWRSQGVDRPFAVRVGIHTGYATVGDFGSEGRVTYTAIGRNTNLAARIESAAEPGEVWVSEATRALCGDAVACEDRGEHAFKGFREPVRVHRVLGLRDGAAG